jgi:excisionase family DNA binding protein
MQNRSALFVRIPTQLAEGLDRLAFERRTSKQDLVADALRRITVETRDDALTVGHAEVNASAPPEVLTLADVAELLQIAEDEAAALAERGEIPGRRVGRHWRFAREAVLSWLAGALEAPSAARRRAAVGGARPRPPRRRRAAP